MSDTKPMSEPKTDAEWLVYFRDKSLELLKDNRRLNRELEARGNTT